MKNEVELETGFLLGGFVHATHLVNAAVADSQVLEDHRLLEVGEAGEVVLPDEDVGVAQRRQVRQTRL